MATQMDPQDKKKLAAFPPEVPGDYVVRVEWDAKRTQTPIHLFAFLAEEKGREQPQVNDEDDVVFAGMPERNGVRLTALTPADGLAEFRVPSSWFKKGSVLRIGTAVNEDDELGRGKDLSSVYGLHLTVLPPGVSDETSPQVFRTSPQTWALGLTCGAVADLYERNGAIRLWDVMQGWEAGSRADGTPLTALDRLFEEHGSKLGHDEPEQGQSPAPSAPSGSIPFAPPPLPTGAAAPFGGEASGVRPGFAPPTGPPPGFAVPGAIPSSPSAPAFGAPVATPAQPFPQAAPPFGASVQPQGPPPTVAPSPGSPDVQERRRANLRKIEAIDDPAIRQGMETTYRRLYKDMDERPDAADLRKLRAKLAIVLDISGSTGPTMNNLWVPGGMPEYVYNGAALALEWDRTGTADIFLLDHRGGFHGDVDMRGLAKVLKGIVKMKKTGGTSYLETLRALDEFYFTGPERPPFEQDEFVYALWATDGNNETDVRNNVIPEVDRKFDEMSTKRIVHKIATVINAYFAYLEALDERNANRLDRLDNIDVFSTANLDPRSSSAMARALFKEVVTPESPQAGKRPREPWLPQARRMPNFLAPLNAGPLYVPGQARTIGGAGQAFF